MKTIKRAEYVVERVVYTSCVKSVLNYGTQKPRNGSEPRNTLPVQPREQALGSGDEVDHGGQQIVR